jgi:type IV secretory pathway VirB9-like protein
MPLPRVVFPLLLAVTLTGCAAAQLPPAIPAPEVLFEGQELAGVMPYPGPDSETRVEPSRALIMPILPTYPRPKEMRPRQHTFPTQQPLQWQLSSFPLASPADAEPGGPRKGRRRERPEALLQALLNESLVRPSRHFSRGAITIYPYEEGKIYELTTSPSSPSFITLPPGERLAHEPKYNDKLWEIELLPGDPDAETARQTVHLHALESGQTMRLPLRTLSDHTYVVLIHSTEVQSQPEITWLLPDRASESASSPSVRPVADKSGAAPSPDLPQIPRVGVTRLHMGWQIEARTQRPAWMPLSCYDDGERIVIQFPASLNFTTAPAVSVVGTNGKPQIVQSIPYDNGDPRSPSYYIVSGLYPRVLLKDADGLEVRLTRVTGQASPYQVSQHALRR